MSDYITKDSGERVEFESGMRRDVATNKPRFDLLVPDGIPYADQFLSRLAGLMARGAEKYGDRNWELASSEEEMRRFKSSGFRHFIQWFTGEEDEDHAAGAVFNILAHETTKARRSNEMGEEQAGEGFDMLDPHSWPAELEDPLRESLGAVARFACNAEGSHGLGDVA